MGDTSEIDLSGRIMALFIGPNKSAKTCSAVTFPGPVRLYDFDGRVKAVRAQWPDLKVDYKTVGVRAYPFRNIISYLDFCKEFEELQDDCPWGTVIIDSFTSLSTTSVMFQLMAKGDAAKERGAKIKLTKGGLQVPSWDEFNGEATTISQMLDIAKILPCNIIFTAHPLTRTEMPQTAGGQAKKYKTITSFGHKVAQIAPGYFDEIWRFDREGNINLDNGAATQIIRVYTVPVGEDNANTTLPVPPVMDITGKKLFDVVQAELAKHEVRLQAERNLQTL